MVARSRSLRKFCKILQDVCVEPAGREPPERAWPTPLPFHERPRPEGLGLEPGEGLVDEPRAQAVLLEGCSDRGVAVAAFGQCQRPPGSDAAVVDETGPLERSERIRPGRRARPAGREPLLEPSAREVAMPQRPDGDADSPRAAELAAERAGGLAVQRPADGEARADDRLRRDDAPGPAVELDLDATAWTLDEPGDDGGGDDRSPVTRRALRPPRARPPRPRPSPPSPRVRRSRPLPRRTATAAPRRPAPARARAGSAAGSAG
jgi:hypothetical protein